MTRFIAVLSGKGGVGKTTTSINLGTALKKLGKDVTIVDTNFTTPDVGLNLGISRPSATINDVFDREKTISDATYSHESGIQIIPADISINAIQDLNLKHMKHVFKQLQGTTEIVIIDSSAGLGIETQSMMEFADEILVVTNPDLTSVTNALKTIKVAEGKEKTVIGVVLNKARKDNIEMSVEDVESMLDMPVIGIIPEHDDVRKAQKERHPVVFLKPDSNASVGFRNLAAKIIGEEPEAINRKGNFIISLLKKMGLV
ncbi:cell division ATPase MinD [Candidatus Woesearchaeota archaeon]|nr:cell division ATPase MinD [Candidatus Woesearchaeota archaeon]